MNDVELTLYFNEQKLKKLESYLLKEGSSAEHVLQNLLNDLYERTVPERERKELDAKLDLEKELEEMRREAARRFAVIHFHQGDEDVFFTSELRDNFYSIANLYRSTLRDEIGKYPLDSIALCGFGGCSQISDIQFSKYCESMPDDPRVTTLVEFDFDNSTVSVLDRESDAWRTYDLHDVSTAMYKAERKSGLNLDARHAIFETALEDKEIEIGNSDESQEAGPALQM